MVAGVASVLGHERVKSRNKTKLQQTGAFSVKKLIRTVDVKVLVLFWLFSAVS